MKCNIDKAEDCHTVCFEILIMLFFLRHVLYSVNIRRGVVMVSVLAWNVVDREFEPQSGKINDYEIGIFAYPLSMHQ